MANSGLLGPVLSVLVLAYLLMFPTTLLHECGHAIAILAVGMRIKAIQIGRSFKPRFRRIGKVYLSLGFFPDGGMVMPFSDYHENPRRKLLVIYAAGPLANLIGALGGILFIVIMDNDLVGIADLAVKIWIALNFFYFVLNLMSQKPLLMSGIVAKSDGSVIRDLLTKPKDELKMLFDSFAVNELSFEYFFGDKNEALRMAENAFQSSHKSNLVKSMLNVLTLESGNFEKANRLCRQFLEETEFSEQERSALKNNLAFGLFLSGDTKDLDEADRLSEEALLAVPMSLSLISTRGSVLVEMGRIVEGLNLLEDERFIIDRASNQSSVLAMRAKAYLKSGDEDRARKMIRKARKLDPDNLVLKKVCSEFKSLN